MILITGATGLVGSHLLIQLLLENETVSALYRNEKKIEEARNVFQHKNHLDLFKNIIWIEGDINDIPSLNNAFKNIKTVYHCAASISFDPSDEEKLRKTNIEGTSNIVNCCIDFNVERLCYVSSIAALGDAKENELKITEETDWNPEKLHGDYAISKYGAELEVWRGFQEGLQVVIINPGVIFGYGFPKKGSSILFNSIKKGLSFYTKGKVGIVSVEDVVTCAVQLTNSNSNGERYTIVAENKSLEDILFCIADAMKLKRPFIYANKTATTIAWKTDWLLSKLTGRRRKLTKATAISSHSITEYDNSKIVKNLNYRFTNMNEYITKLTKEYL